MNQNKLLKLGTDLLKQEKIEEAEIKAKKLLEFVLKQSREQFISNFLEEVLEIQEQEYRENLKQIIHGKPLQYITHHQEFMGLDFYVDENVLIPQPDTETLVEQAIKLIQNFQQEKQYSYIACHSNSNKKNDETQILDLCTGSGAIAISIAKYTHCSNENIFTNKNIKIIASDISSKALKIAKQNSIQNQVEEEIQFIQSDMFSRLTNHKFDVIASNPPYIETSVIQTLDKEVKNEPRIALDGGKDGLDFYRIILKEATNYLRSNGYVLFEIGYNQGEKIFNLWKQFKREKKCELELITRKPIKDLSGNNRVMIFQKKV